MKTARFLLTILIGLAAAGCPEDDDSEKKEDLDAGRSGDAPDAGSDAAPEDSGASETPWPDGKYISIDEVHNRAEARDPEMLLLNVSDEEFYNLGHIAGSLAIPWDLLAGRIGEVDRTRHVVVYCRRGVRSEAAYTTLTGADSPYVWVMEDGLEAWIARGYPTVEDL